MTSAVLSRATGCLRAAAKPGGQGAQSAAAGPTHSLACWAVPAVRPSVGPLSSPTRAPFRFRLRT